MSFPKFNRPTVMLPPGIPTNPASLAADLARARGEYQAGMAPVPPVGTFLQGGPVMVEGQTSLAAAVRAQKDGFLVDDGVQVAGDYTDAIRAEAGGGIAPPSMPKVGYSAAGYNYPSAAMRTGAALGSVRRGLPTASFDLGAVSRAAPVVDRHTKKQQEEQRLREEIARRQREADARRRAGLRGMNLNLPARVPPPQFPSWQGDIDFNSPSETRRAMISTLMGLGALDTNADPFVVLYEALRANTELQNVNPGLYNRILGLFTALLPTRPRGQGVPAQEATENALLYGVKCDVINLANSVDIGKLLLGQVKTDRAGNPVSSEQVSLCYREIFKAAARWVIVQNILADKIDLSWASQPGSPWADWLNKILPTGQTLNDVVNQSLVAWLPIEWQGIAQTIVRPLPLDMNFFGIRTPLLKYLYQRVHDKEIQSQWLDSLSNQLANEKSGSMERAIALIRSNQYKPNASPPPSVKLAAGITPPYVGGPALPAITGGGSGGGAGGGGGYDTKTETRPVVEQDNTMVYVGALAAVALIGVGVYMKTK